VALPAEVSVPSAIINPGKSPITLNNVLAVDPGRQDEAVQIVSEATEKAVAHRPPSGFHRRYRSYGLTIRIKR
jgi:hypothetical protein